MRKTTFFAAIAYLVVAMLGPIVVSAGLGISPGNIINATLLVGSVYKQDIVISQSDPTEDMQITISADVPDATNWFSFTPGEQFVIPAGEKTYTATVVVTVPKDAALRKYTGAIRVTAVPRDAANNGGVSVTKGARIEVDLTTTNQGYSEILVRSVDITDAAQGEQLSLTIRAENKGNTLAAPTKVTVEFQNLNQVPIDTIEFNELDGIPVSETKDLKLSFTHQLPAGEYFAIVKIYSGETVLREERLNFKIAKTDSTSSIATIDDTSDTNRVLIIAGGVAVVTITAIVLFRIASRLKQRKNQAYVATMVVLVAVSGLFIYTQNFTSAPTNPNQRVSGIYSDNSKVESTKTDLEAPPVVTRVKEKVGYDVYSEPADNAAIVYTAKENEELTVLEEQSGWYKVNLPTGGSGWIKTGDVKETK